jgi:hypothetical protein
MEQGSDRPSLVWLGKTAIALFVVGCIFGAWQLAHARHVLPALPGQVMVSSGKDVEFGIAYGTEKQRWLEWAVEQFKSTPQGKHIQVNLIPMGSLEGAHAALNGEPAHPGLVSCECRLQGHFR